MNIKRNARIATIAAIACVGISTPAMAFTQVGPITSGGKPTVDNSAWKKCWAITYGQWREDGASISTSATAADWTCGPNPG